MDRFGVQLGLARVASARIAWAEARATFDSEVESAMTRLILEAVANRMSIEQIAQASTLTTRQVRRLMRDRGLDPKQGRGLLSQAAAVALQENAALLGIDPLQMDLTSPLAYLPMGKELRGELGANQ
jgi:hypothetical protein